MARHYNTKTTTVMHSMHGEWLRSDVAYDNGDDESKQIIEHGCGRVNHRPIFNNIKEFNNNIYYAV